MTAVVTTVEPCRRSRVGGTPPSPDGATVTVVEVAASFAVTRKVTEPTRDPGMPATPSTGTVRAAPGRKVQVPSVLAGSGTYVDQADVGVTLRPAVAETPTSLSAATRTV